MRAELERNYFELFGLVPDFAVDVALLAERYRALQRQFHPDRFAHAADAERRLAVQVAAHLNEAHQTLRDPMRRGRYLLQLTGVDTQEETDTVMDPEFLMEQMSLRERLEAAGEASRELQALADELEARYERQLSDLSAAFAAHDYTTARARVRELQFLGKVRDEIATRQEAQA